ncbi:MAG: N-formylglutamate amidohydrolase [Terasakiella sp.]|uniref:N-formylglutamate amidohydrolase n=1 Tax=unclassified Terasakiella TaxID=2614952 RepID=UPI003AFFABD1
MGASTTEAYGRLDETTEDKASFAILYPKKQTTPVVYASPHSGCYYPQDFIESSLLSPTALRRSEDAFIDEIYESCTKFGSPLLKAVYPRAYIDVNREPYELDPDMFDSVLPSFVNTESPRAQAGLGTIAKIVTNGANIYREKLHFPEIDERIKRLYHPYHAALRRLIEETREQFGICLLIDCHSMPSGSPTPNGDFQLVDADIILGDRFGTSCNSWITEHTQGLLEEQGFRVKRNRPYAGGFTTQHYGEPARQIHVLQIELNRALYMDEDHVTPLAQLQDIKRRLQTAIESLNALVKERL